MRGTIKYPRRFGELAGSLDGWLEVIMCQGMNIEPERVRPATELAVGPKVAVVAAMAKA